ncbi:sigma-54-dependent transcriptional regulator [Candidatus Venteria ishoeyi]|uniref:Transcriptional regulatory protein ZraR n=1 Tax=Candidatus Venteria ishoeyi TaxID=1899563 RepID=A0A1H6FF05_9GAMM|nr:sigma-54 dependent transcriptional regulator [Candidatus Venteria ishoeyi]MDM8545305.1 sigma-54 dependent transcriptional regulator [Candidatus Venteria ishoeyi]SEH07929.1 Transcriptional regulatory protein ZraR [Candidatus Venteria ishoeyi]
MPKLLIIDDDVASCRTLQLHLMTQDFEVQTAYDVESGMNLARQMQPDLIILDISMPGRSGLEALPDFRQDYPDAPVIMITAFQDMESTIAAMQGGATEYIHKPIDINELDNAISCALERQKNKHDNIKVTCNDRLNKNSMVGKSWMMKEVFKTIGLVAKQPVTVLITGESGTGKELVAKAIHNASNRGEQPFVAINCAALVETLLESDMFGHEKGSFTGAVNRQQGKFELTRGGTIFLDEVGELSPIIQAKLLRVLQEKEFSPIGSSKVIKTGARILAATNVNLQNAVTSGEFREDLFYRLQVVTIDIPPLRERREDIIDLVQVLLSKINKELKKSITRLSNETIEAFMHYDWPGNVRELKNVLTKAVALCPSDTITLDLVSQEISQLQPNRKKMSFIEEDNDELALLSLEDIEKLHIIRVLESTNWHKGKTCEILGVSRPRLRRMLRNYHIREPQEYN